jgi:hypothetical protein
MNEWISRPAFAQVGFGAAAFARFANTRFAEIRAVLACRAVAREASEGWWWTQSDANGSQGLVRHFVSNSLLNAIRSFFR